MLGLDSFYRVLESEIRGANGTEIIFGGFKSDPDKFKSTEGIDILWIEEASAISAKTWETIIPTIRKDGSEIWIVFNPDQETDPTYQRFVKNPPPEAWVRKVSWRDNPWFPGVLDAERRHLARVDPDAYAHVWEGDFNRVSEAQVFRGKWAVESFAPQAYIEGVHDPRAPRWDGPYYGLDFGFSSDPTHAVECWLRSGSLYIRREARGHGIELDDLPGFLDRAFPGITDRQIRCDESRPEAISYLVRHGFPRATRAKKGPGSVQSGVGWIRSCERVVIHPSCPALIEEARLYAHKIDPRTGEILPDIVDKHNHGWDAVRYALSPMILGAFASSAAIKIPSMSGGYG